MNNLPKQDCAGRFCPIFDNLAVDGHKVMEGIMGDAQYVGIPAHMFEVCEQVGEVADTGGAKCRAALGG